MTTTALRWLAPSRPEPVRSLDLAGPHGPRGDPLLAGCRHDGVLATPLDGHAPARDLVGCPEARATQLAELVPTRAVVCLTTAAWVHTGRTHRGPVQTCPAPGAKRVGTTALHLAPDDVVRLGAVAVTTELRTACDVACLLPLEDAAAILLALRHRGLALDAVGEALARQHRRPFVRRARELVATLGAQAVCSAVRE